MPIITVHGQMGSGASDIGKLVASKIKIDYVDREIIAEVANRLRWPETGVEKKEMPPGTFISKIADALGHTYIPPSTYPTVYLPVWEIPLDDQSYLVGLNSVIKELAESQSIVIRGRGSQFILKDHPEAIHALLAASFEVRLKRVMETTKLNEDAAKKEIERNDSSRREFIKRYFRAEIENPLNYHMVINTDKTSYKFAASLIIDAVNLRA